MKKTFKLEDLDCANCAAKMETAVSEMDGVVNARVNFLSQSFTLEAPDDLFDKLVKQAAKKIKRIEPDCRIVGV